jgi:hypothetical protein
MKYLKTLLVIVVGSVMLTSCRQIESPEAVVAKFVNHYANREFEEAKQYGTASTIEIVEMTALLDSYGFYMEQEEVHLISKDDVTCEVSGSTALCSFDEYGETVQLSLVLENRKWLVDMNMDFPDDFELDGSEFDEAEEDTLQDPEI